MNREIKFRAWNREEKKMISIRSIDFVCGTINEGVDCLRFDEIELMQFAGLKDVDGKEIYEGDIIASRFTGGKKEGEINEKFEVKFGVFNLGVNGFEYDFYVVGPFIDDEYHYHKMISGGMEVIGNVFENPELLK